MRKLNIALILCLLSLPCFAASFNSKDGNFSISLPPKWQKADTTDTDVLNLKKGVSKINITALTNCNNLKCLENTANKRIKQLKTKKIKLIKNTYSGEEIKKSEFSTLDPYLYFNYTASNINYTEGYFLANSNGYKIELSNLPHTDADLYLSFIAPKPKEIKDIPLITEEKPLIEENITAPEAQKPDWKPLSQTLPAKAEEKEEHIPTFIVSHKFTIIILLIFVYITVAMGFFAYNFVFSPIIYSTPTNPKSIYPIMGTRLYGSPDLFFKLYDSQGNNFIITSQRWSSFLKEYGLYGAIGFTVLHFIIASLNQQCFSSSIWFNTALSLCYLFVAFGLVFMLAGYILDMIFPAPIFVYTDKGKILFKIVRRNNGFFKYNYLVLTNAYTVLFRLETKKIFLIRKWTLFDQENQIALIREESILKALARKLFGHLGGSLRTRYLIEGRNESSGRIVSLRKVTTNFQIDIDKPQALPSTAMVALSAVIFTKNRDKLYPWFD